MSKGGRFITVMPSTVGSGEKRMSRITPMLAQGTIVTVPRTISDYVITEFGITRLKGKTQRERALGLISIAHPDFRDQLKKEADKLYWP
jgi:4-hydroxybutyrate CoA-transferase